MKVYGFGAFRLDIAERKLSHGDTSIGLTPKAFDTLAYLVEHSGHLVGKEELMQAVWQDAFVEEGNLSRTIHTLRRALEDDRNGHGYIETVPKKGYRFVAAVEGLSDAQAADPGTGETAEQMVDRTPRRPVLIVAAVLVTILGVGSLWSVRDRPGRIPGIRGLLPFTTSGKALEYFKQGRIYIERHDNKVIKLAEEDFDKAIATDPNYADPYAGKADARMYSFWASSPASHDDIIEARKAVQKALDLDTSNSYAHTVLCRIKGTYDWEFAEAEKECRTAVELNPKDHEARRELALLLESVGRWDEAMADIDTAVALAPTSFNKKTRGMMLYFARRYDDAIEQLKQVTQSDDEFDQCATYLMKSFEMKGDAQMALEYYMQTKKGSSPDQVEAIRSTFATGGWPAVLKMMPDGTNFQSAGDMAQRGEYDRAFQVLNDMAKDRRIMTVQVANEPRFDPLKGDERYGALIKRIGLPVQ